MDSLTTPSSHALVDHAGQEMPSLEVAIQDWLHSKFARTNSERTLDEYASKIHTFRLYLQDRGLDLDYGDLRVLRLALQEWAGQGTFGQSIAANTRNQRVSIIASFYRFALQRGMIMLQGNPADLVERSRVQPYDGVRSLSTATVRKAMKDIDVQSVRGQRDYALIIVALTTGRRAAELVGLRIRDLSVEVGNITIAWRRVKGGKKAYNALDRSTSAILNTYLTALYGEEWASHPDEPLWRSWTGKSHTLTYAGIRYIFKQHLSTSKVHASRHTFARLMREAGADVREAQAALGHAHIGTTEKYLPQLDQGSNPYSNIIADLLGLAEN